MTVEERATETIKEFVNKQESLLYGQGGYGASFAEWSARLELRFAQALRDQIEECEKIADEEAGAMNGVFLESTGNRAIRALAARECATRIKARIRALAGDKEQGEQKR